MHLADVSPKQSAHTVLQPLHFLVAGFGHVPLGQVAWHVLSDLK